MPQVSEDRFVYTFIFDSSRIDVYESKDIHNDEWNAYLEHTKNGQYEQTDYWSRLKKLDGWSFIRIIYRCNNKIIGGFLILYKSVAFNLNIGYITRGPVFDDERLIQHESIHECLKKCCDNYKIIFILIQQPDDSELLPDIDKSSYLLRNNSINLVEANVQIDLLQPVDEIVSKFKRDKIKNIKKASKLNSTLREGGRQDLSTFFGLMLKSCERHHVTPQPDNLDYLLKMWDLFSEKGMMRLFFIELDGEAVSAILLILFNQKAYKWKFGWSGKYPNSGINDYLYFKIVEWAKSNGFRYLTDMGIEPDIQMNPSNASSASLRKVRFGGDIVIFPPSYFFISNPFVSYVFRIYKLYRILKLKTKTLFAKTK